jgi:hypothetical protein
MNSSTWQAGSVWPGRPGTRGLEPQTFWGRSACPAAAFFPKSAHGKVASRTFEMDEMQASGGARLAVMSRPAPGQCESRAPLRLATSISEAPTTTSPCLLHGLLPASPQGPRELRHTRRPHTVEEEKARPPRLLGVAGRRLAGAGPDARVPSGAGAPRTALGRSHLAKASAGARRRFLPGPRECRPDHRPASGE